MLPSVAPVPAKSCTELPEPSFYVVVCYAMLLSNHAAAEQGPARQNSSFNKKNVYINKFAEKK